MPRVMFDLDAVVCNFNAAASQLAERMFPEITGKLPRSPHEAETWHWQESVPAWTHEMDALLWAAIKAQPSFWDNVPCLLTPTEVHRVRRLDPIFCTARPPEALAVTAAWLINRGLLYVGGASLHRKQNPPHPALVFDKNKAGVAEREGVVYAIDDHGDTVIQLLQAGVNAAVLSYPYNKGQHVPILQEGGIVVHSVTQFLNIVEAGSQ